jgi:hypothetical protein
MATLKKNTGPVGSKEVDLDVLAKEKTHMFKSHQNA